MAEHAMGGIYIWKHDPATRLVYLGHNFSGNGYWHQFALRSDPARKVWCEVLDKDMGMLEQMQGTTMQFDLEKWLIDNQSERYSGGGVRCMSVSVDAVRALLKGKVLCDAEAVAHIFGDDLERMKATETFCQVYSVEVGAPDKGKSIPLYAAADAQEGGSNG